MATKFQKAKGAGHAKLKIAFYGSQGTGKTFTSLLLGEGLAAREGKRIAYIDTEFGTNWYAMPIKERKVHPEAFDFDVIYTRSVMEMLEAVRGIDPNQHGVVIVDSVTHAWDAAKEAYTGPKMRNGQIPIQAWAAIKKPYKQLMAALLDGNFHAIICGRESIVMEEDENTGEMKVTGAKIKAEGETGYEPHLLARMSQKREKKTEEFHIESFFEKDRSGVLAGRTIIDPNFDTFAPVISHLTGGTQAKLGAPEDAAEKDAEAISREEEKATKERSALFTQIKTAIQGSRTLDELKAAWELTTGKKKKLGEDFFSQLETAKDSAKVALVEAVA